mmetsp:Transcript_148291/g.261686  ORF Transcript_148291/g.261686 Transcript_148291/m.261686 type:complete len:228 (+) Transcript_148291:370-1053(+)
MVSHANLSPLIQEDRSHALDVVPAHPGIEDEARSICSSNLPVQDLVVVHVRAPLPKTLVEDHADGGKRMRHPGAALTDFLRPGRLREDVAVLRNGAYGLGGVMPTALPSTRLGLERLSLAFAPSRAVDRIAFQMSSWILFTFQDRGKVAGAHCGKVHRRLRQQSPGEVKAFQRGYHLHLRVRDRSSWHRVMGCHCDVGRLRDGGGLHCHGGADPWVALWPSNSAEVA